MELKYKIDTKQRYCKDCGKLLSHNPKAIRCHKCAAKLRSVTKDRICLSCGIKFKARIWRIKQGRDIYCSRKCKDDYQKIFKGKLSPRWKGGTDHRRGIGWRIARQWALVRANNKCENCEKENIRLFVHHINPYRKCISDIEANSLDNLRVLCLSCHAKADKLGKLKGR